MFNFCRPNQATARVAVPVRLQTPADRPICSHACMRHVLSCIAQGSTRSIINTATHVCFAAIMNAFGSIFGRKKRCVTPTQSLIPVVHLAIACCALDLWYRCSVALMGKPGMVLQMVPIIVIQQRYILNGPLCPICMRCHTTARHNTASDNRSARAKRERGEGAEREREKGRDVHAVVLCG